MAEIETPILDRIAASDWVDASDREKWEEYERRKQELKELFPWPGEYERRLAEIAEELGI